MFPHILTFFARGCLALCCQEKGEGREVRACMYVTRVSTQSDVFVISPFGPSPRRALLDVLARAFRL